MTSDPRCGPVDSGGPDDRLLTWDRVQPIAGISRTTAWRMQKAGDFPEPVTISPKRVGWWESELNAWKASRKAGDRPKPLAPPRAPRLIETARSPRTALEPVRDPHSEPPSPTIAAPKRVSKECTPVQADLPLGAPVATAQRSRSSRKRIVSPDQIDFGF